jgi:catechol 2,3-dioxygenase-like lactoylglutathione lyase family enzyme
MINGAHVLLYSSDAEADRKFFRDVLNLKSVDAGHGWLIFALPPAETAVHPSEGRHRKEAQAMLGGRALLYVRRSQGHPKDAVGQACNLRSGK